ncbi:hypothetical protein QAD02_001791 [Eretmocerus hayati]|uniref:Uncharacterized protein n=1 Tax=Eretmocerus hayati TaxID=131215 RepID=A0ACC2NHF4_9HYME|nr:hypothetical protein QAD02_001791 [Eretmocerus hayati]
MRSRFRLRCSSLVFLLILLLRMRDGECKYEVSKFGKGLPFKPVVGNEVDSTVEDDSAMYVDNRIDSTPTFVSPVEKILRAVIAPIGWIEQAAQFKIVSLPKDSVMGKLWEGLTKPIRNIVEPTDKAIRGGFGQVLNLIGSRFKAIYPGTEWCGDGNVAPNLSDVGVFKHADRCCRSHDLCKISMDAGASIHGLLNNGIYTRSHCSCDASFYRCLKEAHSLIATNIGFTYFNILRPQCFKEEYPARCVRYGKTRLRNNKCITYDFDRTKRKIWQWFDTPDFL